MESARHGREAAQWTEQSRHLGERLDAKWLAAAAAAGEKHSQTVPTLPLE